MAEAAAAPTTKELREFLLWARANGYRISHVEMGGVAVALDDLKPWQAAGAVPPQPRSVHEAFAGQYGIPAPDEDDDETEDRAS